MSRVFFQQELECVATFWRIVRRDGVTMGFTSHDRDLRFGGVLHRSAPGMVPSAIRRSADIDSDSAEVQGALAHDAISEVDLSAGRFDGARIAIGLVDWESLEAATLYHGEIGTISEDSGTFSAELQSSKTALQQDVVPRTSPTCRARFCGPGCNLNPARFVHERACDLVDLPNNVVRFGIDPSPTMMLDGSLRWIDGPHAGLEMHVVHVVGDGLLLDQPLDAALAVGTRALLREGCDHTLFSCSSRFANAVNFQGEPFLPGNDLLARYPTSST